MRSSKSLGELADDITVGFVGSMSSEYVEEGVPFLRSLNVKPYSYKSNDIKYISKNFHNKIKKSALKPGDVVAVRTGNPGASCVIPEELPEANCSDLVVIRCGDKLDPYFVSYYINSITHSHIKNQLVGAIQKHFNIGSAKVLPFPDLDKKQQVEISSALRVINQKIELNNKINAELEAMAKLIYDYWFLQFDFPDANGKPYKSSGGKMVYNEALKREIPDGWGNTTLGDICDLYQPQTISEKEMTADGKYLVYGANGVVGKYNSFNHEKCVVTITCRGNSCGTINTTRPFGWITGNAMVVNPKYDYLSIDYLVNSLYWANVSTVITGSAQPQITRTNLAPLKLVSPDSNLVKKYWGIVEVNHSKRVKVQEENEQLKELRDWLLPMLMNGQVIVKI